MSVQEQIESLRVRRAAEWYELMTSGEARETEQREFQAWLAESPLNNKALLKLTAVSRELRAAVRERGFDRNALLDELRTNVVPLATAPANDLLGHASARRAVRGRWLGIAASAVLALIGIWLWVGRGGPPTEHFHTAAGEQRTINLADGSVVYLNSKSRLSATLNAHSREIFLTGEALFQVARDAQRPFEVHTADAAVRAVGTAFNVSSGPDGTHVAVIEGKVQVSPEAGASDMFAFKRQPAVQLAALEAGEAVRVSRRGAIERRPGAEAANATAWREHRVIIDGLPLEQAIEEFNRYQRRLRLRVADVPPRSHHYSGSFDALDPQAFADFLAREPDLIVERRGEEILIRGRKAN